MKLKLIHQTAKEISFLYDNETVIPGWMAYPFWFITIIILGIKKR